jgi:hypothetical protein
MEKGKSFSFLLTRKAKEKVAFWFFLVLLILLYLLFDFLQCHTGSLSLYLPHYIFLSHSLTHSLSLFLTHPLSLFLSHTHIYSNSLLISLSLSLSLSFFLLLPLSLSFSRSSFAHL